MSEDLQGFEKYTPSRLEWLVVMLNSMIQYVTPKESSSVVYAYLLGRDGNTIVMHMKYFSDMPPELVKRSEDIGKSLAITLAKNYKCFHGLKFKRNWNPLIDHRKNSKKCT